MSILKIDSKLPISGEDIKYEHIVHLFDKHKLREVNILYLNNTELTSIPKSISYFKHLSELYINITKKPKTSEAQLKAIKTYYSKKSDYVCEMKKKYYEKMKQNPEWVEKKNKISKENYHKKKMLAQTAIN